MVHILQYNEVVVSYKWNLSYMYPDDTQQYSNKLKLLCTVSKIITTTAIKAN